jgi:hypothetical protein
VFASLGAFALQLCSLPAVAADEAPAVPPAAAPAADRHGYAATLGISYALAPLFALGIGGLLSKEGASDEIAVAVAGTMFLAPAGVHLYEGAAERALLSLLSMVGLTFAGTLAGGGVGYLENQLSCDPEQNSECQDRGTGTTILGAVIGTFVGYTSSAVLDVALGSSDPAERAAEPSTRTAQLWLQPLLSDVARTGNPAPSRSASAKPLAADGLLIGLTLGM